jgi:tetratricopeptide (TPR) repeat protein
MTGYLHSDKMDHVRDRIASTELEEAISKREKMRISSSTMSVSNQFYTEIRRDIQRASKNKDQYEKILRRLDIALNLSPEDFQLWHYRGITLGKKGDFGQAIYFFDKVIQTIYPSPVALYNKAVALAALDHKVEVQTILEDLLSLNPNDIKAQESLDRVRDDRPIDYETEFRFP